MRFAGTASQYSKKAMPQLTSTAPQSGVVLNLRWPYQAKVMNTFEARSMTTGAICGFIGLARELGCGRGSSCNSDAPLRFPPRVHDGRAESASGVDQTGQDR